MTMSDRIAVMRGGRIEQLGSPEELYERPHSDFVANFLGVSNLLEAEVTGREGATLTVRLPSGALLRAPANGVGDAVSVRIGVRPEKLHVQPLADGSSENADASRNAIEGIVLDSSYVGVSTQYIVETPDGRRLVVYAQNLETSGSSEVLADGQRVRLTWNPQHTFVISAGEAGEAQQA